MLAYDCMRHLWLEGGMGSKRIPIPWFPTFLEEKPTKTQDHPIKSQEEQSQDDITSCFKKYLALEDKLSAVVPFREYYIAKHIFKYGRRPKDLHKDYLKSWEMRRNMQLALLKICA